MQWTRAGDVACAPRTRAVCRDGIANRKKDESEQCCLSCLHNSVLQLWVLTQTEIVVAAPNGDGA